LFVFCDGPKGESDRQDVTAVRKYIRTIQGFRKVTVIEAERSLGLAASITNGVSQIVDDYGSIIVMEDDLLSSPGFLTYINEGLRLYSAHSEVMSITGFMFPVRGSLPQIFFLHGGTYPWGWGTWKRAWHRYDPDVDDLLKRITKSKSLISQFNFGGAHDYVAMLEYTAAGKLDSWYVRWYASVFLENGYGLWPGLSMINNIGLDGTGRHGGTTKYFDVSELADRIEVREIPVEDCRQARKAISDFYRPMFGKRRPGTRQLIRFIVRHNLKRFVPQALSRAIAHQMTKRGL
jgi:hypothetical protein